MPHPAVRGLALIWTRLLTDRIRTRLMWWLNAKFAVGVTAILQNDRGEVLFMEHVFRKQYPWALPGGWIGRQEHPEAAIVRELREETGLDVVVERLVAANTFSLPRLDIVYLCRAAGGHVRASPETPNWRWCPIDDLPADADPYSLELVRQTAAHAFWQEELLPSMARAQAG